MCTCICTPVQPARSCISIVCSVHEVIQQSVHLCCHDVPCTDTHIFCACCVCVLFVYRYIDKVLICKCAQRGGPCEAYHDEVSSVPATSSV
jgi:hypothetical protein